MYGLGYICYFLTYLCVFGGKVYFPLNYYHISSQSLFPLCLTQNSMQSGLALIFWYVFIIVSRMAPCDINEEQSQLVKHFGQHVARLDRHLAYQQSMDH